MTLTDLIAASAERLVTAGVAFGHGTTNAHDEAAWLVLWKLDLPLETDTATLSEHEVTAEEHAAVDALLARRITTRQPAAYLTKEAWLQGIPFYIDERAIVPRSFIAELLVDPDQTGALDYWLNEHTEHVLDLCTGNGSLAVLAAMIWPEVLVDACDISADALAVARINVDEHGLPLRIRLFESDGLAQATGPYDLILCNPPYVNSQSMAALPPEYQAEPALALAGGDDGMDFIRQLLRDAPSRMKPNAVLVLEIGNERDNFEAAFPTLAAVWLDTSAGEDQVLLLTREALAAALPQHDHP